MVINAVDRLRMARSEAYHWRSELSVIKKLGLALGMAVVVGLMAQVRLQLPWTPVPITGQTMAVLLAGILLGRWWGGISLAIYAGLGIAGVPWFNGWTSGVAHLIGPTGGYIIGFVLAALFLGHFTDKYVRTRKFIPMFGFMLFASFILIYVPGVIQLHLWLNLVMGKAVSLPQTLNMGLVPFIAGDFIKAIAAAGIATVILPKQDSR
jgi:biotin transport system substrate-specific component